MCSTVPFPSTVATIYCCLPRAYFVPSLVALRAGPVHLVPEGPACSPGLSTPLAAGVRAMTSPGLSSFSFPLQRRCLGEVGHSLPNFQTLSTRHSFPCLPQVLTGWVCCLGVQCCHHFLPFELRPELQIGNHCKDPACWLGASPHPTHIPRASVHIRSCGHIRGRQWCPDGGALAANFFARC